MGEIIDVKKIVEEKKKVLKEKIKTLKANGILPKLAVIIANHEEASVSYIKNKRKMCDELGILQEEYVLPSTITTDKVLTLVESLNNDRSVQAVLLQLPVYSHLDENKILNAIHHEKDVDGFHPHNLGKLLIGGKTIIPCTPKGIMGILQSLPISLVGKHAVVVGRSRIVGKPIAQLLLNENCTVTTCHSKTKNLAEHTKTADVLVVAVGHPHLVTAEMVKEGAIIVDVGINRVNGVLLGDVDTDVVSHIASYITPVPGGVGLTTVISLMENLVEICERNKIMP